MSCCYILRGSACVPRSENWYHDMWQRKKAQYHHCTSAAVSFFQIKKIYCVTFICFTRWFEDLEEAERYKAFLFEEFFYDLDFFSNENTISIKEYHIPKMFRI